MSLQPISIRDRSELLATLLTSTSAAAMPGISCAPASLGRPACADATPIPPSNATSRIAIRGSQFVQPIGPSGSNGAGLPAALEPARQPALLPPPPFGSSHRNYPSSPSLASSFAASEHLHSWRRGDGALRVVRARCPAPAPVANGGCRASMRAAAGRAVVSARFRETRRLRYYAKGNHCSLLVCPSLESHTGQLGGGVQYIFLIINQFTPAREGLRDADGWTECAHAPAAGRGEREGRRGRDPRSDVSTVTAGSSVHGPGWAPAILCTRKQCAPAG